MPNTIRWRVSRIGGKKSGQWEGWVQIPTRIGLPLAVSARAYTPEAANARAMALARQVAKAPALRNLLPIQARLALTAAKVALPIVKKLGGKALKLFKSIF